MQCDGEPRRTPGRAESLHRSEEAVASAVVAPMVMRVVMSVGGGGGTGGGGEGDGGGATPETNAAPSCASLMNSSSSNGEAAAAPSTPLFPNKGDARGGGALFGRFGPVQKKALCRKPLCSTRPQLEIR